MKSAPLSNFTRPCVWAIALGVIVWAWGAEAAELGSTKVTAVRNLVTHKGVTESKEADVGQLVVQGESVQTKEQSLAELTADDASVIRLGAFSVFSYNSKERIVKLDKGTMLMHTPPGNGGATIESGGVTGAISGTTFMLTASPAKCSDCKQELQVNAAGKVLCQDHPNNPPSSGGFALIVLEGSSVTKVTGADGATVDVAPGQMAVVGPKGSGAPRVYAVNITQIARTSPLINAFPNPLPSMPQIIATAYQLQGQNLNTTGTSAVAISSGGELLTAASPPPNPFVQTFVMASSQPGQNNTTSTGNLANIATAAGGGGGGGGGGLPSPTGTAPTGGGGAGLPTLPGNINTANTSGQQGVAGNPTPISATATVTTKVYDGTTDADLTGASLTGSATSASLANDTTGTFASKNVGTGITVTTGMTLTGSGASLFRFTAPTLTGTITAKDLSVFSAAVTTKVYDGTDSAVVTGAVLMGNSTSDTDGKYIGNEVVTLGNNTAGTFASKNVGNQAVATTMTLGGADSGNYTISQPTLTGTITAKALTMTGSTAATKVYDGNTTATVTVGALSGEVTGETLGQTTAVGTYNSKNVVGANTVTAVYTLVNGLNGELASNYSLANDSLAATITAKALTMTGSSVAPSKVYDGNTTATVTVGALSGEVAGETLGQTTVVGTYNSKNVVGASAVTAVYTLVNGLNGELASNYSLANDSLAATITAKALTMTGSSVAPSKVYDGNTTATVTVGALSGEVTGETLGQTTAVGTYNSKNVVGANTVTAVYTLVNGLNGELASNYSLANDSLAATITAKALTMTGSTVNKEYDGNTTATVSLGTLSGLVGSEQLQVSLVGGPAAGTFGSKDVGGSQIVTVTYQLADDLATGGLVTNYNLTNPTESLTGTITAKPLSVTAPTIADKVYDGQVTAGSLSVGTLSGFVGSETVTASGTAATYSSANVGSYSTAVTYTLANGSNGGLAGNYSLAAGTATGTITAKDVTIGGGSVLGKIYDGNTTAAVTASTTITGLVAGESLGTTTATGTFASKDVGTRNVGASYTLTDGANPLHLASNYNLLNSTETLSATITAKTLSVTAPTIASKVYDGQVTAGAVTVGTLSGFVGTETVTATGAAANYSSANVGTYNSVSVTYTLANGSNGGLAGNYSLAADTANGTITAKTLAVTAPTIASKVYDGQVTAGAVTVGTLSGFVGTETVTASGVAADYSSANVGTYNSVAVTYTLANGSNGGLAGNYSLAAGAATGVITAKALAVTAPTIASKVYDGQVTAGAVTVGTLSGFVGTETVTASGTAANYSSSNVGTYNSVAVSYTLANGSNGGLAGNYSLAAGTANGTITAKPLSITAPTIADKVYDGQVTAGAVTVGSLSGFVGTETVTASGTAANYSSANVGSYSAAVTYTLADGLNGGLAGNYSLAAGTANGTITAKALAVTAPTIADKVYDGQVTAGAVTVGTLSGFVGSETVTATGAAANYSSANVGTYNSVAVSYTLANGSNGGLAGNYSLASGSANGTITAKALSVTAPTIADKVYDGQVTAGAVTVGTLSGFAGTETVTASGVAADYSSANVGTYNSVPVTYTLANGSNGGLAGNYSLAAGTATGVITAKALAVTVPTIADKVYDGQVTAGAVTVGTLSGFVGTETVTATGAAANYSSANVGTYNSVAVTYTLANGNNGGLAGNYSLAAGAATAVITAKDLVVNGGGITVSKAYNNSTAINAGTDVVIASSALTGGSTGPNDGKYIGTENVTLAVDTAGTFERRLPGTEIPISTTVKLASGNAVNDNYTLRAQPTGLKGTITGSAVIDQNGAALNVNATGFLHVRDTTATRMQDGMTFQTSAGEVLIENSSFDGWMQRSSTATKVDDGGAVTFQFTESAGVAVNSPVLRIKMEANDPNAAPGAGGANLDYMLLGDYQMQLRHDPNGTPASGDERTRTIFSLPGSADDPSGIGSMAPSADLLIRDSASTEVKNLDWDAPEYSLDVNGEAAALSTYATASGEYKPDSPAAMNDFNTLTAAGDWEVDVADPKLGGEGKVTDLRLKYNNNTKVLIEGPDGVQLLNVKFEGMDEVDVRTDLNNRVLMSATLLTDPDITKMVVKASQTLEAVINSDATFKEVKSLSNADLLAGVVRDNSSPTGFSFVGAAERTLTIDGPGAAAVTPNINIAGQLAIAAHTVVFNNANISSGGVIDVRTRDGMVNRTYGTVVPGTTSFTGGNGNYFLNRGNGISMTIGNSGDIAGAFTGGKLTDIGSGGTGTVMSVGKVQ